MGPAVGLYTETANLRAMRSPESKGRILVCPGGEVALLEPDPAASPAINRHGMMLGYKNLDRTTSRRLSRRLGSGGEVHLCRNAACPVEAEAHVGSYALGQDDEALNLDKLERFVEVGRLDPGQLITMKTLRDQGVVSKNLKGGVKVLGRGAAEFRTPVHLEVSQASATARAAIEKAGGSVTEVYYNRLGLRALLKPEKFPVMIKNARPPPKLARRFQKVGELPAPTALPE